MVTRFLYLPRRSAWRWAPWIGESDWPSSPRVFYFLSCLPTIDRGEQGTPKGQKSSPPYLPTSWLHTCKPISITCLVDRGCCQLCLFFFSFFSCVLNPEIRVSGVLELWLSLSVTHARRVKNVLKTCDPDKALSLRRCPLLDYA